MSVEESSKTPPKPSKTFQLQTQLQNQRQNQVKSETKKDNPSVKAVVHNSSSIRFHKLCGEAIDELDTTLLARVPYFPLYPSKNHLIVKNLVYIISNWTHDKYPNVLYICLRGYTKGYQTVEATVNQQGQKEYGTFETDRIAALELDQVTAVMDESDVRTYELRYSIRDSVTWELDPEQPINLDFEMKVDDSETAEVMPLPSPLAFNFEIRSSL